MVTFRVSDVEVVRTPLPVRPAAEVVASLGWPKPDALKVAAGQLVDGARINPLVLATHLAFAEHRPLVLSPDAVWLCLAQGLGMHVERHAEALRPRLVRHQGQLELEVRRDDFWPGKPENDFAWMVDALTQQLREHLGGRADLFVADFSTTTPLERTSSQIVLMGAMRYFFEYSMVSMCGIPEVTLEGTPEDWASIRARAKVFLEFAVPRSEKSLDVAEWHAKLDPVLAQLERSAAGHADREFWEGFYKRFSASGGDRVSGWINTFFPYVGEEEPYPNWFPAALKRGQLVEGIKPNEFPVGRTRVPFKWKLPATELSMELAAGLFGVAQRPDGALAPVAGWLVSAARPAEEFSREVEEGEC